MKIDNKEQLKQKFSPILNQIQNKNYNNALQLLNDLKVESYYKKEILKLKSFIFVKLKKWDKVIDFNKELLGLGDNNYEVFNVIGVANFNLGNLNESIKNFKNSINNNKNFIQGYENLGIAFKRIGDFENSTIHFSDALKINNKNNKITQNLIDNFNYFETDKLKEIELCKINTKISNFNKIIKNKFINFVKLFENAEEELSLTDHITFNETQIFRKNKTNLNCERHLKIFNDFSIIPKYCFNCFKVQIITKNVNELIKLYFLFNDIELKNNNIRKCIVELRNNIKGNYKGYIYAINLLDAEEIIKILNKKCNELNIICKKIEIKHGCTEYYEKFPEFKQIKENELLNIYKEDWSYIEKQFDSNNLIIEQSKERIFSNTINKFNLSDYLIIKNWLIYAKIIGDKSCKYIFNKNSKSPYLENILLNQIKFRAAELM